jgi:hypothetical protein
MQNFSELLVQTNKLKIKCVDLLALQVSVLPCRRDSGSVCQQSHLSHSVHRISHEISESRKSIQHQSVQVSHQHEK